MPDYPSIIYRESFQSSPEQLFFLYNFPLVIGGAEEMAEWLRTFVVVAEDLGLILKIHMEAHNCL